MDRSGADRPELTPGPDRADGERRLLRVEPGEGSARLDRWLAERLERSRSQVAQWVEEGRVRIGGIVPRKSEPVQEGALVEVLIPEPEPPAALAEEIPLHVVHEDPYLAVIDKPAGMVVHPAPGHRTGTLVNALLHRFPSLSGSSGAAPQRPGIVHRLDRDTSGLLVVALEERTRLALVEALRERKVRRRYRAAVWGHLAESPIRIDAPIGRDPRARTRMAVVSGGKRALTRARVRERWRGADELEVALHTGRTHQIRVHMAQIGHPVVGDPVYGAGWERGLAGEARGWGRALVRPLSRQFLHAAELGFVHPVTGEELRFRSALPADLDRVRMWAKASSGREGG